jgi:hypothetical protein
MALLNQQFLQNIGITLDEQTASAFDQHFQETLKLRVLDGVIDTLSDTELEELAALKDQDDDKLQAWLQAKVPDFAQIVEDEVAILIGEVAENADSI